MELTAEDLDHFPAANIRVPRAEFVAVWAAAEARFDRQKAARIADWGVWGVVETCRWLARAPSRTEDGRRRFTTSPVGGRTRLAFPELIEAEYRAADRLLYRRPVPAFLRGREAWIVGVAATFAWAWGGSGVQPAFGQDDRAAG